MDYVYYVLETIKRQSRAAYCCLVASQSPWARAWTAAYKLYACSVSDTKAPLQLLHAARGDVSYALAFALYISAYK